MVLKTKEQNDDPYPELNTAWELFLNNSDKSEAQRIDEENKLEQHWQDAELNFIYPWNEDADEYEYQNKQFTPDEIEFMLYVEKNEEELVRR